MNKPVPDRRRLRRSHLSGEHILRWTAVLLIGGTLAAGCTPPRPLRLSALDELHLRFAKNPDDIDAQLALAQAYADQQSFLKARQYLQITDRALALRAPRSENQTEASQRERAFRLALRVAVRAQQFDDAIRRCEKRLTEHEDLPLRHVLSTLYESTGDEEHAERQRRFAVFLHPKEPGPLADLGFFYLEHSHRSDRTERARAALESSLALAPDGPDSEKIRIALATLRFDAQPAKE